MSGWGLVCNLIVLTGIACWHSFQIGRLRRDVERLKAQVFDPLDHDPVEKDLARLKV